MIGQHRPLKIGGGRNQGSILHEDILIGRRGISRRVGEIRNILGAALALTVPATVVSPYTTRTTGSLGRHRLGRLGLAARSTTRSTTCNTTRSDGAMRRRTDGGGTATLDSTLNLN